MSRDESSPGDLNRDRALDASSDAAPIGSQLETNPYASPGIVTSDHEEEPSGASAMPAVRRVGSGLVIAALILPMVAMPVLLLAHADLSVIGISLAIVVSSALLVAIDAYRLGNVEPTGRKSEPAIILFLGMCCMWVLVFPYAYFRRRRFQGPDLRIPAVLVTFSYMVGPFLIGFLVPPSLPSCTSAEVVGVLDGLLRNTYTGTTIKSVDGHRQVSYDRTASRRQGECVIHTDEADTPVAYYVEWKNADRNEFQVWLPPELPRCTSAEVVGLLEQLIRGTPAGATVTVIDGHRDISYTPQADSRRGECVAHADGADIPMAYVVKWEDRDKGRFTVRVMERDRQ